MKPDAPIPTLTLDPDVTLAHAQPWRMARATTKSPAIAVMTDLTQVKAATTVPSTSLQQAEQMMIYLGVRMLFVVSAMPSIDGLLTTTDRHGENQMRLTQEPPTPYSPAQRIRGVFSRAQIERQTGETIEIMPIANSFAAIERALN